MVDFSLLAWVLRGRQRRVIFLVLEGTLIPAQIYERARRFNPKITRNSVSDVLCAFKEKGLVECLNEQEKKGRIYRLTKKGLLLRQSLEKSR